MTRKYSALVHLNSHYPSFNIGEDTFKSIIRYQPQTEFIFCNSNDEFKQKLIDADFAITWLFPTEYYSIAKHLKAVFTPAAGKELVKLDPSNKVPVFYGGFHGPMMFETLLTMQLYFNNFIDKCLHHQNRGEWARNCQNNRGLFCKQHVLILGYGDIGKYFSIKLRELGLSVSVIRRKSHNNQNEDTKLNFFTWNDLERILPRADHIVIILPETDKTIGIFKKNIISLK